MAEILMSFIGLFDPFTLVIIAICLGVGLIFSPTRAIIAWAFKLVSGLVAQGVSILFTGVHEVGSRVISAHIVYLKNWRPRSVVIKTVKADGSIRRT